MAERRWVVLSNPQYRQLFIIQPELPESGIEQLTFRIRSGRTAQTIAQLLNQSEQRAQIVELAREYKNACDHIGDEKHSNAARNAGRLIHQLFAALDKLD